MSSIPFHVVGIADESTMYINAAVSFGVIVGVLALNVENIRTWDLLSNTVSQMNPVRLINLHFFFPPTSKYPM